MRHPDRLQAQHIGEDVVRKRAAGVGQNDWRAARCLFDRAGDEINPGVVRIEPAGTEKTARTRAHLDFVKAMAVKMPAQRGNDVVDVRADHVAELAMRACVAGNGIDRVLRRSGREGQNLEAVPAEDALGRGEFGLSPVTIDRRPVSAGLEFDARKMAPYRGRELRAPFRHGNRAARIGDAGERICQDDSGVREEPAPVAGMVRAFAQINDQIDRVAPAGAEIERRLSGRNARTVGGDEDVRCEQAIPVLPAKVVQPGRAYFLSRLDKKFGIEAKSAALGNYGGKRPDIDAVLSLIVGRAAAIETIALRGEYPGREARAPSAIEPAHRIAMSVDQDGDEARILQSLRHQDRRSLWIVEHARGKFQRRQGRAHLLVEIAPQLGGTLGLLARAWDGYPAA